MSGVDQRASAAQYPAMPFSGLRIVELAEGVAGPYCGRLFAGLGADVLKFEPPGGDRTRRDGPFPGDIPDPERSGLFLHLNTGKRSAVLDLPRDRARLEAALAEADVLVVGERPSRLVELGIDLSAIRARYPRLVVTSVTSFGLDGPYAEYLGDELVACALSGYMSLTGAADREPIKSYGSLVQYQAGAHAALGTLAALFARQSSGQGQIVDVSAMEAGTFMLGGVEQRAHFFGETLKRDGTRNIGLPPQQPYPSTIRPCRDGHVHCHTNHRHRELLHALIPDDRLLDPELLRTMTAHADEIDAILDAWLATRDRRDIVRDAQELRLPFTEVFSPGEVLSEDHHRARGSFVTVEHPGAGPVVQPAGPVRFSETPWRNRPAPVLGSAGGEPAWAGTQMPRTQGQIVTEKPLAGFRVIDFTTAVAGPIASYLLGVLGAEVIKVEAPNARGLRAAGTAPLLPGAPDLSYNRVMHYNALNHSKRAIALDAAKPEGHKLLMRLIATADAFVQNFSPRAIESLGLTYDDLRAANPAIVMTSMPAFGLSGPYSARTSYGPGIDAMSGFSYLTGYADGPPLKPGNYFCDQNAGVHAAFATMAALWHKKRTGQGQHAELAMIEGEFQLLGDAYIDFAMNGRERLRCGNDHPSMAPHGVFPCVGDDQWVAIAVESDAQWQALVRLLARPDLERDARFATSGARHASRPALFEPIAAWTGTRSPGEAQAALQAAGVPAGAVLTALDLLSDPHVEARQGFAFIDGPGVGPTPYPRPAFTLSETPVPITKPAPGFGQDNDYVFGTLLGLTPDEIATLEAAGVTSRVPMSGH